MVCPCKHPLHIIDKRDDEDIIEFLAFPDEFIDDVDGEIKVPKFEVIEEDGKKYMSVLWKDMLSANVKRYDVNEHIILAGCESKIDGKKLQCKRKELYLVLHPLEEWNAYHVVNLT